MKTYAKRIAEKESELTAMRVEQARMECKFKKQKENLLKEISELRDKKRKKEATKSVFHYLENFERDLAFWRDLQTGKSIKEAAKKHHINLSRASVIMNTIKRKVRSAVSGEYHLHNAVSAHLAEYVYGVTFEFFAEGYLNVYDGTKLPLRPNYTEKEIRAEERLKVILDAQNRLHREMDAKDFLELMDYQRRKKKTASSGGGDRSSHGY